MRKDGFTIIFSAIVVILLLFLIIVRSSKPLYESIEFDKIEDVTTGLVYIGKIEDKNKESLSYYKKTYSLDVYNIETAKLEELNQYLTDNELGLVEETNCYLLISESTPVWVGEADLDDEALTVNINKYLYGKLTEEEIAYIVPENANELIKKIKSKDYTILVIGQNDCNYCQLYIPVFNKVAKDNNLDIYYIDSKTYNQDEYTKIKELELEIPASCTKTGVATTTNGSFPKPMTLLIKNGKTVDCLLGYKSETKLLDMLTINGV